MENDIDLPFLVLEDDVSIYSDLLTYTFDETFDYLKEKEWDVMFFGSEYARCADYKWEKPICKFEKSLDTHGYMFNGIRTLQKVIDESNTDYVSKPIDHVIRDMMIKGVL